MPTDKTWANAQSFVSLMRLAYPQRGVHACLTGIEVSSGENMIRVSVSADL